jgi:hypothetical protein
MGFKINAREMTLIIIAGSLIFMTMLFHSKARGQAIVERAVQTTVMPVPITTAKIAAPDEEDGAVQKEMREQMDKDRNQQRQIKMLKMQLEQVDLQLENEKALTEINKLKKENAGYVKDSGLQAGNDFPSIRIIYIGGADEKAAILSIDGTSYSVKAKDKPVANVEVLNITDKGVKVHFNVPRELTTVINYVQE